MRNISAEGMSFEYNYSGHPYMAYFGYGQRSLVFEYPIPAWNQLSEKEKGAWRRAKFAEARQIFGVKGTHHGSV